MSISRRGVTLSVGISLSLFVFTLPVPSLAATPIYAYTDDAGIQNFTNQLDSIPGKYRSQLASHDVDPTPATPPPGPAEQTLAASNVRTEPSVPTRVRTVTASGEYRMGDHDTRNDAVRLAVEAAKKEALEHVATYLESVTEVRNMDVTRDDIRSFTAGIVKVVEQKITTRLEDETVVIRADLTAEVDPHEVAQAIAALRENESAKQELLALRAETDRLQEQLDATNRALAAAPSPEEVQQLSRQREDTLNELQANGLVSQAWTSVVYATPGFYSYPWIGVSGVNGLLLQAQRLYPRHRHLPRAQQMITAQPGQVPSARSGRITSPPRQSLLVPSAPYAHHHQSPPLLTPAGVPAKVGDIVSIPTPRSVPPLTHQSAPQPHPYQLHPSHFWRPSPPNIRTAPSVSSPSTSVSPGQFGGRGAAGGGYSGGGNSGGGHRGR
ncbi:MAG: hypothetical protein H0V35_15745 [Nitrospira sp.]|nr:hypothetical protein [Nitrospira sp.]